jgi:hypothetical protein
VKGFTELISVRDNKKSWETLGKNNTYGKVQMTSLMVKKLCNILHDVVCKLVILTSRVVDLRSAFSKLVR